MVDRFGEDAFAVVETVVYFHYATREQAAKICRGNNDVRGLLDRRNLDAISHGDFENCGLKTLSRVNSKFIEGGHFKRFVAELESWLRPTQYDQERFLPIRLTDEQQECIAIYPHFHQSLRGIAGSGKTVVLATQAARLLEEGKRVLV
ncbi:MAG: hypothetical protein K6T83_15850 [Alicyclobacillus sp.]|uniref:hypothetical protein n=1 Tax=Alicyclobacillus herbarius TaxID=122960 RepID=UPI00040E4090|nr:hypothetical protein [Alicyclobacillus herbarius]MCL6444902.1 hypothetical protein [Alicyclobacillus sp.]